ncbi:MAG: hypothetical protein ACFHU9_17945 [Fluviicola sp.]
MKQILFLGILLLLPGFSKAQDISDKQIEFVNTFVAAAKAHQYNKVYRLLDKSYRKEQRKFLKGKKKQLLDELFAGTGIDAPNFSVIPISEIIRIEVAEVIAMDNDNYTYIFRVQDVDHDILVSLELVKTGNRYGFVGAVG